MEIIKFKCKKIEYRSFADLNNDLLENIHKFPHDVDCIIGIPRSGMLPANLLSLYLQKPYVDIDTYLEGKKYGYGSRLDHSPKTEYKRVLVIDDSVNNGTALSKAKEKLSHIKDYNFIYSAVYASKKGAKLIDCYAKVIPYPRMFQWNFFHHDFIKNACFDMDGVLCPDPIYDDDGEEYMNFIVNAPPKFIPSVKIHTIVTCRLEKYRKQTEEWLAKNNVKYNNLIMLPFKNKQERQRWRRHAYFKAEKFKESGCDIFVESSLSQAKIISKETCGFVFCVETFSPMKQSAKIDYTYYPKAIKYKANQILKRLVKF